MVDVVAVRKLKRPVGLGAWGAYALGVDEYGVWLHTPPGSLYRGSDGERSDVCDVAGDSTGAGRPIVQLIPPCGWWIATWYPPTEQRVVTVDICTPAQLVGRTWTYTDLELDPWRGVDGSVTTDDWDEFRAACTAEHISRGEATEAVATTATVEDLLRRGVEPFGREGMTRLNAAQAMALPPLVTDPPS